MNQLFLLTSRPDGVPEPANFQLVEAPVPELAEGQVLLENHYLSVDPYMRGRISTAKSYAKPVELGEVMTGTGVGRVAASRHERFVAGDIAVGLTGWQRYAVVDGSQLRKFDAALAPISTALGVLGMPGLTAYFGLTDVCAARPGETVMVSGAAGAVGSYVGQMARILGCRVVGSAGGPEKVRHVLEDLGFEGAFDYKGTSDLNGVLKGLCPNGIDCYFDNTGGAVTDAVFRRINTGARIAICGQIASYNAVAEDYGPRIFRTLLVKQARVQGFLVNQYKDRYREAYPKIGEWLRSGSLTYRETIVEGFEKMPEAFIGLFSGQNLGKMLVKVV